MPENGSRSAASSPSTFARQACDLCRLRKVKCRTSDARDDQTGADDVVGPDRGAKCERCLKMGLECTYLLPSGVRGPKRKKIIDKTDSVSPTTSRRRTSSPKVFSGSTVADNQPSNTTTTARQSQRFDISVIASNAILSPEVTHNGDTSHRLVPTYSSVHQFPTDVLCSRKLFRQIIQDYLKYLYPLIPIVHRPTFLKDLARDRDVYDKDFLGLVLALCAVTVGTMPSRFREYCSHEPPIQYHSRTGMINSCYNAILNLRGSGFFDEINYQKWAISYLMQISFFQIGEHNRARMIEVESMQLARLLDLHQISRYDGLNYIETQLRKKGFWLMFYGYVHGQLQNLRKERLCYLDEMILNAINLEELIPLEVDDEMILETQVLPQPPGRTSLTTGFNVHSRVFWTALMSTNPLSDSYKRDNCNCVRTAKPELQLRYLKKRLHDLKYKLDGVQAHLRPWITNLRSHPGFEEVDDEELSTLSGQFASMRANIHVTHLWLQSIISDQIDILLLNEGHHGTPLMVPSPSTEDVKVFWSDREDLCRQLLHVLHGIDEAYLEPNGHHLTFKVRDVAVTLLACPFEPHEEVSRRAQEYLKEFTNKLSRLDGSETMNTLSLQSWVDTDRRPFGVLSGFGVR